MTGRRRFNGRERVALYLAADGRCEQCGAELEPGWHGDHVQPWSLGGATHVLNGQALCRPCNLAKGISVTYNDTFAARPFQRDVIERVLDGIATGRDVTVALGTPGTGKTLAYQATATHLLRQGAIDHIAVFVPRVSLAQQCETSWMFQDRDTKELHGLFELFDSHGRLGKIRHVDAQPPLTVPGETGTGFVACYASLANHEEVFSDWAEKHKGRFLLVADEAQFCGAPDEKGNGTRAGALIEDLHEYAAHTLLLTGTPYRADGRPLVLAQYGDVDEEGKQLLIRQAEATYADGIDAGYLRRFEMLMNEGVIKETDVSGEWSVEYKMSSREANLSPIMRKPTTWQPLANRVVNAVREKQILNPEYRGLISCMEKKDAEAVQHYLTSTYPGLRVYLAVSADGAAAQNALQDFKIKPADILVTVRMAFIGYDCPRITVVGILTHYRDKGHLMQLVGRGLRTWDKEPAEEQSCRVIAPDDPRMEEFLSQMRRQSDEGLRRKRERDNPDSMDGAPRDASGTGPITFIEETKMTTVRAVSNDAEVEDDEFQLLDGIKRYLGAPVDVTMMQNIVEEYGIRVKSQPSPDEATTIFPEPETPQAADAPLTDKQQIERAKSEVSEVIKTYLANRGILGGRPDYGTFVGKITSRINKAAGCSAGEVRTVEQAEARLAAARRLCGAT